MNEKAKERIYKTLAKLGTIFVDRRFITSVVSLLILFFGVEEDKATEMVQAVGTVLVALVLVVSWTIRQPTGLSYEPPPINAIKPVDLDQAIGKFLEQKIGIKIE
jgi:hypothetical protein